MQSKNDVDKRVRKVIEYAMGTEKSIRMRDKLKEDLGVDSLTLASIMFDLETEFDIRFKDSDLNPAVIRCYADIVRLIEKYL